jgi:hypothetical protein
MDVDCDSKSASTCANLPAELELWHIGSVEERASWESSAAPPFGSFTSFASYVFLPLSGQQFRCLTKNPWISFALLAIAPHICTISLILLFGSGTGWKMEYCIVLAIDVAAATILSLAVTSGTLPPEADAPPSLARSMKSALLHISSATSYYLQIYPMTQPLADVPFQSLLVASIIPIPVVSAQPILSFARTTSN